MPDIIECRKAAASALCWVMPRYSMVLAIDLWPSRREISAMSSPCQYICAGLLRRIEWLENSDGSCPSQAAQVLITSA